MFDQVDRFSIHKGDVLFESSQYGSIEVEFIDEPVVDGDKWTAQGRAHDRTIDFLVTKGFEHYGPRFYKLPQYTHNIERLDGSNTMPKFDAGTDEPPARNEEGK
jgi:hypothetical protein